MSPAFLIFLVVSFSKTNQAASFHRRPKPPGNEAEFRECDEPAYWMQALSCQVLEAWTTVPHTCNRIFCKQTQKELCSPRWRKSDVCTRTRWRSIRDGSKVARNVKQPAPTWTEHVPEMIRKRFHIGVATRKPISIPCPEPRWVLPADSVELVTERHGNAIDDQSIGNTPDPELDDASAKRTTSHVSGISLRVERIEQVASSSANTVASLIAQNEVGDPRGPRSTTDVSREPQITAKRASEPTVADTPHHGASSLALKDSATSAGSTLNNGSEGKTEPMVSDDVGSSRRSGYDPDHRISTSNESTIKPGSAGTRGSSQTLVDTTEFEGQKTPEGGEISPPLSSVSDIVDTSGVLGGSAGGSEAHADIAQTTPTSESQESKVRVMSTERNDDAMESSVGHPEQSSSIVIFEAKTTGTKNDFGSDSGMESTPGKSASSEIHGSIEEAIQENVADAVQNNTDSEIAAQTTASNVEVASTAPSAVYHATAAYTETSETLGKYEKVIESTSAVISGEPSAEVWYPEQKSESPTSSEEEKSSSSRLTTDVINASRSPAGDAYDASADELPSTVSTQIARASSLSQSDESEPLIVSRSTTRTSEFHADLSTTTETLIALTGSSATASATTGVSWVASDSVAARENPIEVPQAVDRTVPSASAENSQDRSDADHRTTGIETVSMAERSSAQAATTEGAVDVHGGYKENDLDVKAVRKNATSSDPKRSSSVADDFRSTAQGDNASAVWAESSTRSMETPEESRPETMRTPTVSESGNQQAGTEGIENKLEPTRTSIGTPEVEITVFSGGDSDSLLMPSEETSRALEAAEASGKTVPQLSDNNSSEVDSRLENEPVTTPIETAGNERSGKPAADYGIPSSRYVSSSPDFGSSLDLEGSGAASGDSVGTSPRGVVAGLDVPMTPTAPRIHGSSTSQDIINRVTTVAYFFSPEVSVSNVDSRSARGSGGLENDEITTSTVTRDGIKAGEKLGAETGSLTEFPEDTAKFSQSAAGGSYTGDAVFHGSDIPAVTPGPDAMTKDDRSISSIDGGTPSRTKSQSSPSGDNSIGKPDEEAAEPNSDNGTAQNPRNAVRATERTTFSESVTSEDRKRFREEADLDGIISTEIAGEMKENGESTGYLNDFELADTPDRSEPLITEPVPNVIGRTPRTTGVDPINSNDGTISKTTEIQVDEFTRLSTAREEKLPEVTRRSTDSEQETSEVQQDMTEKYPGALEFLNSTEPVGAFGYTATQASRTMKPFNRFGNSVQHSETTGFDLQSESDDATLGDGGFDGRVDGSTDNPSEVITIRTESLRSGEKVEEKKKKKRKRTQNRPTNNKDDPNEDSALVARQSTFQSTTTSVGGLDNMPGYAVVASDADIHTELSERPSSTIPTIESVQPGLESLTSRRDKGGIIDMSGNDAFPSGGASEPEHLKLDPSLGDSSDQNFFDFDVSDWWNGGSSTRNRLSNGQANNRPAKSDPQKFPDDDSSLAGRLLVTATAQLLLIALILFSLFWRRRI